MSDSVSEELTFHMDKCFRETHALCACGMAAAFSQYRMVSTPAAMVETDAAIAKAAGRRWAKRANAHHKRMVVVDMTR